MLRGPRPFGGRFSYAFEPPSVPSLPTPRPALRRLLTGVVVVASLASGTGAAPLAAQGMAEPVVPRGLVRLEFTPTFSAWDHRYGLRTEDGSNAALIEPLGADLTDANGARPFAGLALLQQDLLALTGAGSFTPRVGGLSGVVTQNVTRLDTGARLGLLSWLTVGVTVPYVKTRTAIDIAFHADSVGANLGVNPVVTDAGPVNSLLSELQAATQGAQAGADQACAAGPGDACTSAQALLQRVSSFSSRVSQAYFASPFFPLQGSAMADALVAGLGALNSDLVGAGLPGVASPMVFAAGVVDDATFRSLTTSPDAGIQGSPLQTYDGLWELGDIEVTADLRLLDGEVRDSGAVSPRFAWTLTGGALVRLGTGRLDDPNVFLDVGSGDGQTDFEGHVAGALRLGGHLGLTGGFRYGVQQATTILRRVAPPEAIIAPVAATRAVRWTPGRYTDVEISPRLGITPELALSVDYRRFHKDRDTYALAGPDVQTVYPVDVSVLARETEATLEEAAVGLRYSTRAAWREGRSDTPIELGIRLIRAVGGAGGQVPKATRGELTITLFRRLWGSGNAPRAAPAPER
jgi:hypothetical protein